MLYFDHAATTPVHPDVAEKMDQVSRLDYGNPSSIYSSGSSSKSIIESARNQTAKMIDSFIDMIPNKSSDLASENIQDLSIIKRFS